MLLEPRVRRGKAESTPSRAAVATAELLETIFLDKAVEEEGSLEGGLAWRALRTSGTLLRVERLPLEGE